MIECRAFSHMQESINLILIVGQIPLPGILASPIPVVAGNDQ
jgi:hypothetical protein